MAKTPNDREPRDPRDPMSAPNRKESGDTLYRDAKGSAPRPTGAKKPAHKPFDPGSFSNR